MDSGSLSYHVFIACAESDLEHWLSDWSIDWAMGITGWWIVDNDAFYWYVISIDDVKDSKDTIDTIFPLILYFFLSYGL